jgi:hypothetical protein
VAVAEKPMVIVTHGGFHHFLTRQGCCVKELVKSVIRCMPGGELLYRRLVLARLKPGVLGLTTAAEREYYHRVAATQFLGKGAVIDLGSWFGSTAASLAQGLEENPSPQAREALIHTYDIFLWDRDYDSLSPNIRLRHGESFLPVFKANVRPWLPRIVVHQGDLNEAEWSEPVEVLLNDAAKTWSLAGAIWKVFVSRLLVGGLLIEQDFKHYYCPWIHLMHYRYRDYFELAEDVRGGSTTAFRLTKAIPEPLLDRATQEGDYGPEEVKAAFAWTEDLVYPEWRPAIVAAHATLLLRRGDESAARALLDALSVDDAAHHEVKMVKVLWNEVQPR